MTAVVVGNNKGGVGKDEIAQGLFLAAMKLGLSARLIELESSARLSQLYPDATTIRVETPAPEILYRTPDVIYAPFDEAGRIWRSDELSITSLGANLTSGLLAWGRAHGRTMLDNGAAMTVVIVLTMSRAALASGLTNLYDTGVVFPGARRVAILNDVHADFLPGDRNLAARLEEARGQGRPIETVHIVRNAAPAWGYAQNCGTLAEIAALDPQVLLDLGLPEGPVRRSMPMIVKWINDELIRPLEVLLPEVPAAKRRERAK